MPDRPPEATAISAEPQPTPALQAAARRRRELREALVAFEEALSSPIRDRFTWRADVADALEALGHAFEDHVTETEAAGGLYEEMRDTAPHLGAKARRLREEHPVITAALTEASSLLAVPPADEAAADAARDGLQRLMGRIVRHRQHGADLVWEAYAIDIGDAG
ncbi:MAG TPA: hypothetical protein VLM76_07715 [Patescibacteria group bacterium]|nr:hypothetical protein [Patescibacteria group bacterium]